MVKAQWEALRDHPSPTKPVRFTRYKNHFAVPTSDIAEGDTVFNRKAVKVIEFGIDGKMLEIQIHLADGSLIVAKPEERFPVNFPASVDLDSLPAKYPIWTWEFPMPRGVKLNKESKPPAQQFPPTAGQRYANDKGKYRDGRNDPKS